MIKTLACLLLFSSVVFAAPRTEKIHVSIKDSYFSCSYLKSLSKKYLKAYGARDISIRCSGGLPNFTHASLRANYDAPTIEDEDVDWKIVDLKSNSRSSCQLEVLLIEKLFQGFEVASVDYNKSCFGSRGRYNYEIVLMGWN